MNGLLRPRAGRRQGGCLLSCLQSEQWQSRVLSSAERARPQALQRAVVQARPSPSYSCFVSLLGAFCHLPRLLPWILQIEGGSEWRRRPCYPTRTSRQQQLQAPTQQRSSAECPLACSPRPILLPALSPQCSHTGVSIPVPVQERLGKRGWLIRGERGPQS